MILLALDTCDSRGSLAVLRDGELLAQLSHDAPEDYSSWILPNLARALDVSGLKMEDVDVFAAAAGPGAFTALRVGLTSIKAWSEVYGRKIASVSRLEAIASQAAGNQPFVAAFVDAQREQIFAGLFARKGPELELVEQELVIAPEAFLHFVTEKAGSATVAWISMDPEKLTALNSWRERQNRGESMQSSGTVLAPIIGRIGFQRAKQGRLIDAIALDAEYVRRSDAEIFWKGHATHR